MILTYRCKLGTDRALAAECLSDISGMGLLTQLIKWSTRTKITRDEWRKRRITVLSNSFENTKVFPSRKPNNTFLHTQISVANKDTKFSLLVINSARPQGSKPFWSYTYSDRCKNSINNMVSYFGSLGIGRQDIQPAPKKLPLCSVRFP